MFDLHRVRKEADELGERIARRGDTVTLERTLELDAKWRAALADLEALRQRRNELSEQVSARKRQREDASDLIAAVKADGARLKELEETVKDLDAAIHEELAAIPNAPAPDVPVGDEACNLELRRVGSQPTFSFPVKAHYEIGEALGILDFARAAEIAGPRFVFLKGDGARLERALVDFMLDVHRERGYEEMIPPFLVNADAAFGTAQLPKFGEDMFRTTDGRYLIPTAEVPLTNYHRGEILEEADLPLRYCAYSPCFRSEAGSAGRDTRGLIRMHQFSKVELVRLARPEASYQDLETLTADAEEILRRLELPYRVVLLATGDMGFASAKTYDIEVWLPSQDTYREISSCTNFEDFQARRAGVRFRPGAGGKPEYVHTLNGSGLAVGRTMAALLENGQQEDGTVLLPKALQPYVGGKTHLG